MRLHGGHQRAELGELVLRTFPGRDEVETSPMARTLAASA
jgi:hypothetical protein